MKKVLATTMLIVLCLSGCQEETTITTTDLIAAEAIEQNQDVIRLNDRVYRLDQLVTVSDLSLSETTLKDGMANRLKSGTVIYQEKDDTMFLYVQRNKTWYRYQSIPEG